MENILVTSLSIPDIQKIFRQELDSFFNENRKLVQPAQETSWQPGEEQPVTGAELAEFLHISSPTLIRWRDAGKIPHMRIGGRILYKKSEVLKALEQ